jgi:isopentenyl diphosphate isomerase/L-lactate dehydrogenase-like FMN-dependent dehydrogenase
MLEMLRSELELAMALAGIRSVSHATPALIRSMGE